MASNDVRKDVKRCSNARWGAKRERGNELVWGRREKNEEEGMVIRIGLLGL
jgi:hypothetical protein